MDFLLQEDILLQIDSCGFSLIIFRSSSMSPFVFPSLSCQNMMSYAFSSLNDGALFRSKKKKVASRAGVWWRISSRVVYSNHILVSLPGKNTGGMRTGRRKEMWRGRATKWEAGENKGRKTERVKKQRYKELFHLLQSCSPISLEYTLMILFILISKCNHMGIRIPTREFCCQSTRLHCTLLVMSRFHQQLAASLKDRNPLSEQIRTVDNRRPSHTKKSHGQPTQYGSRCAHNHSFRGWLLAHFSALEQHTFYAVPSYI